METKQTPEQISQAAHEASSNARTAEQHLAAAALHLEAMEHGVPAYRAGHQFNANSEKLLAKKAAAKAAGNNVMADRIARGLRDAAQIGR
jgi:hypothetical protein